MISRTIIVNGEELDLWNVQALPSGFGQYKITVDLMHYDPNKGLRKATFWEKTNNIQAIDKANNEDDYKNKWEALYNIIADSIEKEIVKWLNKINNEKNNSK